MLWTNPDPGTVAFGDAVVITLICGGLVVFWLWRDGITLGGQAVAPRLRASWRRLPEATRVTIGGALLCALVGAGLAALLNFASH